MNTSQIKKNIKKTVIGKFLAQRYYNYLIRKPKKSYSQIGEDLILDHLLKHKVYGFYVDIGAYHPVHLSNTYLFYKRGWDGIQIEPNENRCALFKTDRPKTLTLNIGIGGQEGGIPFYIFEEEALSTFSKTSAESAVKHGHSVVAVKDVPMFMLRTVFNQHVKKIHIDILSVDTEGYDLEILQTNDWELYRPTYIVVETAEYNRDAFGEKNNASYDIFFKEKGYSKIADTYLNTIYQDMKQ